MSRLNELKSAENLKDLAKILEFTPKGIAYNLYKVSTNEKYTTFNIPKKGGGTRTIDAPKDHIKLMQSKLSKLLYDCLDEIEKENPTRRKISHGFHKNRGIISNASPHIRTRYVLNIDISDFFGAINFGRVRGYFIADKSFSLNPNVATVIAQIACHNNKLPQGSPCSPIISNLILRILDIRLARLAKNQGCMYTRYADDMTFSTRQHTFPPKLAKPMVTKPNKWRLNKRLLNEITQAGFKVNPKKNTHANHRFPSGSYWSYCK